MAKQTTIKNRVGRTPAAKPPDPLDAVRAWLRKLQHQRQETWLPLPAWAQFYLEVGAVLAVQQNTHVRTVFAFAVPARDCVAALIAAGYIACRAVVGSDDFTEHIRLLESLLPGAVVTFTEMGRKYKATLEGIRYEDDRIKYIEVRTGKQETRYVNLHDAGRIEVLDKDTVRLPKYPAGQEVDPPAELLISLLPERVAEDFIHTSRIECLLIGRRNQLEYELLSTGLGYTMSTGGVAEGHLQDLVRANSLSRNGNGYRCIVLPTSTKYHRGLEQDYVGDLVVFDGAASFNRWRELWRCSHWVVILDRTAHDFEEARLLANQEHSRRTDARSATLSLPGLPPGVEMMAFEAAR